MSARWIAFGFCSFRFRCDAVDLAAYPDPQLPSSVKDYRALLIAFSKDTAQWAKTAHKLRIWMAANDPDYPTYHMVAPEGWINDPNGVSFDPRTGLYHRFYQYNKFYSKNCNQHDDSGCSVLGVANGKARTWGHTVSKDLAIWEDWPGIDADTPYDHIGVWSGNCVLQDSGEPMCIYTGARSGKRYDSVGVCAYSSDWIHWDKTECMPHAPSWRSQASHDDSIFRDGTNGTWYILSGGCTFRGTNHNSSGVPCEGNAQLWSSTDLRNFKYVKPITPGGPGEYWELPYLLPFDAKGQPIDNFRPVDDAAVHVLMFGLGNAYWVGHFDGNSKEFVPLGVKTEANSGQGVGGFETEQPSPSEAFDAPHGWPRPNMSDTTAYYSFNPQATDTRGPGGATRRLMFGWILGPISASVQAKVVPFWQSAHSLARLLTVSGSSLVQLPAPEVEKLRSKHWNFGPMSVTASARVALPGLKGDALEILATFSTAAQNLSALSFGLGLRVGGNNSLAAAVGYNVSAHTLSIGQLQGLPKLKMPWNAHIVPQPMPDTVSIRVFLDRSIIEVYSGGAAITERCNLSPGAVAEQATGVEIWAQGGSVQMLKLDAWRMESMWGEVTTRSHDASVYV